MLSHIWGQTNQSTNRLTDQLLELLEWLFATKKYLLVIFLSFNKNKQMLTDLV